MRSRGRRWRGCWMRWRMRSEGFRVGWNATNVSSVRSDKSEQNGWLESCARSTWKRKKKESKVFAIDRSIDISHSHPERESLSVPPSPPLYPSHPIRSDHPPTIPIHRLEKAPRTFNFSNACKWLLVLMRFDLKRQLVPFLVHTRTDRQTDRSVSCLRKLFVCVCG